MSVIPCQLNEVLKRQVDEFSEVLRTESHNLGAHGLSETDFYRLGVFEGAVQRIRGQLSAEMREKREFVNLVLEYMQDKGFVKDWESSGGKNRHDYTVRLLSGRTSVIELKGCLDGNNTTIFERPAHAEEFIIWSVCKNAAADPRKNVWSGIHTRLSAEIIVRPTLVDGLVVWDWICGTIGRPCPKLADNKFRVTTVAQHRLPPPCIYLFPATIPEARNNPNPEPHSLKSVEFLDALHTCFGGSEAEINRVRISVRYEGNDLMRTTTVERNGVVEQASKATAIRRR
jgi:hypothetical protein